VFLQPLRMQLKKHLPEGKAFLSLS
jgi:hypothetical protein